MKKILHKADSRGFADHGWLKSYHTFSFAGYHDADRMNFGALRVLNDDLVQPDMGFGTHPHQNMEIISIPLEGALSHKDNMGNTRAIEVNEVQVMSAGTGLTHSEFNDSKTEAANFLQLWIIPEEMSVKPNYEQRSFNPTERKNKLQTLVAPKDKLEGNALPISQQAYIYRTDLDKNHDLELELRREINGFYIFLLEGSVDVEGQTLERRDAIGVYDTSSVRLKALSDSQILVIEVPMK